VGTEEAEWWVDPTTALPLRNEREVRVETRYGSITITYTETASFAISSLRPG
jgi:hypothetical protein